MSLIALSDNVTVSLVTAAATIMAALIVLMQRDSSKQAEKTRQILSTVQPLSEIDSEEVHKTMETIGRRLDHVSMQTLETANALNIHREVNVKVTAEANQAIGKMQAQVQDIQLQVDRLSNSVALLTFALKDRNTG